jgi:hypothetical protein
VKSEPGPGEDPKSDLASSLEKVAVSPSPKIFFTQEELDEDVARLRLEEVATKKLDEVPTKKPHELPTKNPDDKLQRPLPKPQDPNDPDAILPAPPEDEEEKRPTSSKSSNKGKGRDYSPPWKLVKPGDPDYEEAPFDLKSVPSEPDKGKGPAVESPEEGKPSSQGKQKAGESSSESRPSSGSKDKENRFVQRWMPSRSKNQDGRPESAQSLSPNRIAGIRDWLRKQGRLGDDENGTDSDKTEGSGLYIKSSKKGGDGKDGGNGGGGNGGGGG